MTNSFEIQLARESLQEYYDKGCYKGETFVLLVRTKCNFPWLDILSGDDMKAEDFLYVDDDDMENDDRLEPEVYAKSSWTLDEAIADYLVKLRGSIPEARFDEVDYTVF